MAEVLHRRCLVLGVCLAEPIEALVVVLLYVVAPARQVGEGMPVGGQHIAHAGECGHEIERGEEGAE